MPLPDKLLALIIFLVFFISLITGLAKTCDECNSHELIKNKGSKLIHTAQEIIDDLDLVGLLEANE